MELQLRLFVKRLCYTEHEQLKQAKPICEIIISGDDILIATVVTFYVFQIFRFEKKGEKKWHSDSYNKTGNEETQIKARQGLHIYGLRKW